jgi:streptogramin lyase
MQYIELGDLNFKHPDKKYIIVFIGLYFIYETSIEPAKFVLTDYSSEQNTRYFNVDNQGNFWFQNNSDELVSYNGLTENKFNNPLNINFSFALSSSTQTFFVDRNTSYGPWTFYTFNESDIVQDTSFQALTDYLTTNDMNDNTSNWTMDNDGTLWLIAESGNTLLKFSKPATIEKITLPFHLEQYSSQPEMKSNKRGVLWFKNYEGFLHKYKNGTWEKYNVNEMQFF